MSTPVKYADLIMLEPNAAISGLMMALSGLYWKVPGNRDVQRDSTGTGPCLRDVMERFKELHKMHKQS